MPGAVALIVALWPGAAVATDSVEVSATLSSTAAQVGERVTLEITARTRGPAPEIEAPVLPPGLEILETSDRSSLQFTLPGGRTRTVQRTIVLAARQAGEHTIPAVAVHVRGETHHSLPLRLRVTGGPAATAGPAVLGAEDEVVLRAWIEPDTAYVGQQVDLHVEVLFADDVRLRLRRAPTYELPAPSGFWTERVTTRATVERHTMGGRPYEAHRRVRSLVPLVAGEHAIPPVEVTYDLRHGFLYRADPRTLATDSLRIVVLAPPDEGRPDGYTGAVGRYTARADLVPRQVPAGEAAELVVEIEGTGHVRGLAPPVVPELEGLRVYSPAEQADAREVAGRLGGSKRFTWVVVPDAPGRIEMPPIAFSYFEPGAREYRTLRLEVPALVAVGDAVAVDEAGAILLRGLKPAPVEPARIPVPGSTTILALILGPLAALGLAGWTRRPRRARPDSPKRRNDRFRGVLGELRREPANPDAPLRLADAFQAWIIARLGGGGAFPDPVDRAGALERAGANPVTAAGALAVLRRLHHARFRPDPFDAGEFEACLAEVERIFAALDRQLVEAKDRTDRSPRAARSRAALLSVLLVGVVAALAGGDDLADAELHFRTGTAAYDREDYDVAVAVFLDYVGVRPDDPHGWYNLGNAHFHAGSVHRAAWAWLRALELSPRDGDVRHNLKTAAVPSELLTYRTIRLRLTPGEALLAASAAWAVGVFAFALGLLGWLRRWRIAAGVPLAITAALALATAPPLLRSPAAMVLESDLQLLAEPTFRGEPIRELEPGSLLRLREHRGAWVLVRTSAGQSGWVESDRVGPI